MDKIATFLGTDLGQGFLLALVPAVLVFLLTVLREYVMEDRRARIDSAARLEEYRRRRRDEFESVLVDFAPVADRWCQMQRLELRFATALMADDDPEPDEERREQLEQNFQETVTRLRVLAPSDTMRDAIAQVAEARSTYVIARKYADHLVLHGVPDDVDGEGVIASIYDAVDSVGKATEALVDANAADVR